MHYLRQSDFFDLFLIQFREFLPCQPHLFVSWALAELSKRSLVGYRQRLRSPTLKYPPLAGPSTIRQRASLAERKYLQRSKRHSSPSATSYCSAYTLGTGTRIR